MEKTILIIDEEQLQLNTLTKAFTAFMRDYRFEGYSTKADILNAIENRFYTLAILDINSLDYLEKIFELNPIANVIIISDGQKESFNKVKSIIKNNQILDYIDPGNTISATVSSIRPVIISYYEALADDVSILNTSLLQNYSEAKNEMDTYKKGILFERFISLLFGFLGYREIARRIVDASRNEVDLSIRNEIKDSFLNKFGKYILMECKNTPDYKVSKINWKSLKRS